MVLREIADSLGIARYPASMDALSLSLPEGPACDLAVLDALQEEFGFLGKYYPLVRELGEALNEDPALSLWVRTGAAYAMDRSVERARLVPVPAPSKDPLRAMLPLYVLLAQVPKAVAEYRQRGFEEAMLRSILCSFAACIGIVEAYAGQPGIDFVYYRWMTLYVKASIYHIAGLDFELRTLPEQALYLQHRETGEYAVLLCQGTLHRSGKQILGSAGYTDDADAFSVSLREDDAFFYGHPVKDGVVSPDEAAFAKAEWHCVAAPGDPCLSVHIPRGTDFSPQGVDRALAAGVAFAKAHYPDIAFRALFCSSWLLDPNLAKLLGPQSKISQFSARFGVYPQLDNGTSLNLFVFPPGVKTAADLPEDTSLRRKIKAHYAAGNYLYSYAGIILQK